MPHLCNMEVVVSWLRDVLLHLGPDSLPSLMKKMNSNYTNEL